MATTMRSHFRSTAVSTIAAAELGFHDGVQGKIPADFDAVDSDELGLRGLRYGGDEPEHVGVRACPRERHEDALRLHECASLARELFPSGVVVLLLEVVWDVYDDGVRAEQERGLETECRLAVQKPLPPVMRDEFGEYHRDRPVARLAHRVDVLEERREKRSVRRLDDVELDIGLELRPPFAELLGARLGG